MGLQSATRVFQPLVVSEIGRIGATIETAALSEILLTLGDHFVVVDGRVAHAHITV